MADEDEVTQVYSTASQIVEIVSQLDSLSQQTAMAIAEAVLAQKRAMKYRRDHPEYFVHTAAEARELEEKRLLEGKD